MHFLFGTKRAISSEKFMSVHALLFQPVQAVPTGGALF